MLSFDPTDILQALQIIVYTHAVAGNRQAATFVYPQNPSDAPLWAAAILNTKLQTYLAFNETYPGFGGFLPWFLANETSIRPTADWVNRVPALDNGELLWAVYGLVSVLHQSKRPEFQQLGDSWERWMNYTKMTAARVRREAPKVCVKADHVRCSIWEMVECVQLLA